MVAAAAVLFQFVLATIASASAIGVRPTYVVLASTDCLILPRALFTPAPTWFAKSTLEVHNGTYLDATRKNNVRLIAHVINNVPSEPIVHRGLSAASKIDTEGMTNEECTTYCGGLK